MLLHKVLWAGCPHFPWDLYLFKGHLLGPTFRLRWHLKNTTGSVNRQQMDLDKGNKTCFTTAWVMLFGCPRDMSPHWPVSERTEVLCSSSWWECEPWEPTAISCTGPSDFHFIHGWWIEDDLTGSKVSCLSVQCTQTSSWMRPFLHSSDYEHTVLSPNLSISS